MANPFYVTPALSTSGGQQAIAGLGNILSERREMQAQREEQQRQEMLMQQMQAEVNAAFQSGDPNQIAQVSFKYPQMGEMLTQQVQFRNERTQQNMLDSMRRVAAGEDPAQVISERVQMVQSQGGDPSDTIREMQTLQQLGPEGYRNLVTGIYAGMDPKGFEAMQSSMGESQNSTVSQQDFDYFQDLMNRDPDAARAFGMAKGYIETGREAAPTTTQRDWKEYQRLKREASPEEARQYGQAAGFVSKEGRELSTGLQRRLSEATDSAVQSGANVIKYNDLASQIDDANIVGGWSGRVGETLKEITGQQDFKSELRRDYYAIRGSEVVNNLPPGAASDADIAMAMAGFPNENASGNQIASFLRGLAKINQFKKQYDEFRASYISDNGTERGMLQAWKDQGVEIETPQRTIGKYQVSEVN